MLVYPKDIAENYFAKRPVMGIAYVGTMLEKAGHDVLLVDMRLKGYTVKYFKKLLHEFKPDVVGFSLVALSLDQAYELMKIVKEESGAIVVAGGPEVTLLPTKFLSKSFIDYAFMGEGEHSFLEFVNMYEKGESFYNIPGLCYRNEDGTPRVNPPKPIQDLDALPFPNWELFPLKKYKRRLSKIKFPIASSRGCPYTCKFCHISGEGKDSDSGFIGKFRYKSIERVEEEMDGGYGIFAGSKVQWAQLRFTENAAPWVSQESWHPLQETEVDATGALMMKLPYVEPTELIMDILRWGPDVEVLRPAALKQAVSMRLAQACALYK